jgi:hypothetical protein
VVQAIVPEFFAELQMRRVNLKNQARTEAHPCTVTDQYQEIENQIQNNPEYQFISGVILEELLKEKKRNLGRVEGLLSDLRKSGKSRRKRNPALLDF